MIDVNVFIIGVRRGPDAGRGWKTYNFKILPRVGETITTKDGWTYYIHSIDHYVTDGAISMIVNKDPKD